MGGFPLTSWHQEFFVPFRIAEDVFYLFFPQTGICLKGSKVGKFWAMHKKNSSCFCLSNVFHSHTCSVPPFYSKLQQASIGTPLK